METSGELARPLTAHTTEIILQKTAIDFLSLVNEIVANAALLHEDVGIQIFADQDDIIVLADRFRISQVITNLVNNAIKYSPGKPVIKLNISTSHSAVTFRVTDQGMGIAPQDRAKVFHKFYRSGERHKIDGLGIGLFLCSEIIIRHGGVIGIEERAEPGTTVYFMLPS